MLTAFSSSLHLNEPFSVENEGVAGGYCDIRVIVRTRFFKYWKEQFSGDMDWPVLEISAEEVREHVRKRLENQASLTSAEPSHDSTSNPD